jgi:phosphoacetylglucosamine mutase
MDTQRFHSMMKDYRKLPDDAAEYTADGLIVKDTLLPSAIYRCGILMGMRANHVGHVCGIMIVYCPNTFKNNCIKLIDSSGDFLEDSWIDNALQLINCNDTRKMLTVLNKHVAQYPACRKGTVIFGYQQSKMNNAILQACRQGIKTSMACSFDAGQVTTPELYYHITSHNHFSQSCYLTNLVNSHSELVKWLTKAIDGVYPSHLVCHVDCGNGVGGRKLSIMNPLLKEACVKLVLYNREDVSQHCGVDHVTNYRRVPANMGNIKNELCCSIDEDADRIVFFTKVKNQIILLPGERIATLFAVAINDMCDHAGLTPSIGIIQTSTTNGACTSFIKRHVPKAAIVTVTTSNVHVLHTEAQEYDIGIYFDLNGCGTVVFSPLFMSSIADNTEAVPLLAIYALLGQHTGDALGNLLVVLAIIQCRGLTYWLNLYQDLPNRSERMYVGDSLLVAGEHGNLRFDSYYIQNKLLEIGQKKYSRFVISPCTTDVVRVFVEGSRDDDVNETMERIMDVFQLYKNLNV